MRMHCFNCRFDLFDGDFEDWFKRNQQPTPAEKAQEHANEFGHTVQITEIICPELQSPHVVEALQTVSQYFSKTEGR